MATATTHFWHCSNFVLPVSNMFAVMLWFIYIYISLFINNIYIYVYKYYIYISLFILQRDGTEMMSRDCCCEAQKSSGALRADLVHQFQAQQRLP